MESTIQLETDRRVSLSGSNDRQRVSIRVEELRSHSDEDLLRLCAESQSAALEELTRRFQAPIYRFLYRMLNSPEDAEEATLDVFVRAWQHAGRFQYRAKVATWLYRIAVNIARDMHSRKKARPQEQWPEDFDQLHNAIGSAEDDAMKRLERADQSKALTKALDRLSEGDRLILVLYYFGEREYDEIQAITGLSYTVLKTRLARARKRLRTLMGEEKSETI